MCIMTTKLDELCTRLVEDLAASLDTVTGEWKPCWNQAGLLPTNVSTGKPYQGLNTLFLWGSQIAQEFPTAQWATYKQWQAIGGQVRKGEKGTGCVKWVEGKPKEGAAEGAKKSLFPVGFTVFNVAQQDGWVAPEVSPVVLVEAEQAFEEACAAIPFSYQLGSPSYAPALDVVRWPHRDEFFTGADYCATKAHELAHWTGHKSRLDRDLTGRFGDDSYAAEELVAEISAALTVASFQLTPATPREDHARYIKHWLRVLKNDPRLLLTAAQLAQKATNHLLSYAADRVLVDA